MGSVSSSVVEQVNAFTCPVTHEVMKEPIVHHGCGRSFESNAINACVATNPSCPSCKIQIAMIDFSPNLQLKECIEEFPRIIERARLALKKENTGANCVNIFTCPITFDAMEEPVIHHGCGRSFESSALADWVAKSSSCPNCRAQVTMSDFSPNLQLKECIEELPRIIRAQLALKKEDAGASSTDTPSQPASKNAYDDFTVPNNLSQKTSSSEHSAVGSLYYDIDDSSPYDDFTIPDNFGQEPSSSEHSPVGSLFYDIDDSSLFDFTVPDNFGQKPSSSEHFPVNSHYNNRETYDRLYSEPDPNAVCLELYKYLMEDLKSKWHFITHGYNFKKIELHIGFFKYTIKKRIERLRLPNALKVLELFHEKIRHLRNGKSITPEVSKRIQLAIKECLYPVLLQKMVDTGELEQMINYAKMPGDWNPDAHGNTKRFIDLPKEVGQVPTSGRFATQREQLTALLSTYVSKKLTQ